MSVQHKSIAPDERCSLGKQWSFLCFRHRNYSEFELVLTAADISCTVSFGDQWQPVGHWIYGVEHLGGISVGKFKRSDNCWWKATGFHNASLQMHCLSSRAPEKLHCIDPRLRVQIMRLCWYLYGWFFGSIKQIARLFLKLHCRIWVLEGCRLPPPLLNWNLVQPAPLVKKVVAGTTFKAKANSGVVV